MSARILCGRPERGGPDNSHPFPEGATTVDTTTRLEPLGADRAQELFDLMHQMRGDTGSALALDHEGRVLGVVGADDPHEDHLLGDFDVHA